MNKIIIIIIITYRTYIVHGQYTIFLTTAPTNIATRTRSMRMCVCAFMYMCYSIGDDVEFIIRYKTTTRRERRSFFLFHQTRTRCIRTHIHNSHIYSLSRIYRVRNTQISHSLCVSRSKCAISYMNVGGTSDDTIFCVFVFHCVSVCSIYFHAKRGTSNNNNINTSPTKTALCLYFGFRWTTTMLSHLSFTFIFVYVFPTKIRRNEFSNLNDFYTNSEMSKLHRARTAGTVNSVDFQMWCVPPPFAEMPVKCNSIFIWLVY